MNDEQYYQSISDYCKRVVYPLPPPLKTLKGYDNYEYAQWWKYFCDNGHLNKYLRTVAQQDKIYRYLITFTLKPEAVHQAEEAEAFVREQSKRVALKWLSFTYVKELTKQGAPHFHCAVETTQALKKNRFEYYAKKFGFVDISKTRGQTIQEALTYISKEGQPIKLI